MLSETEISMVTIRIENSSGETTIHIPAANSVFTETEYYEDPGDLWGDWMQRSPGSQIERLYFSLQPLPGKSGMYYTVKTSPNISNAKSLEECLRFHLREYRGAISEDLREGWEDAFDFIEGVLNSHVEKPCTYPLDVKED